MYYFPENKTFHANCLRRQFAWNADAYFLGKNMKILMFCQLNLLREWYRLINILCTAPASIILFSLSQHLSISDRSVTCITHIVFSLTEGNFWYTTRCKYKYTGEKIIFRSKLINIESSLLSRLIMLTKRKHQSFAFRLLALLYKYAITKTYLYNSEPLIPECRMSTGNGVYRVIHVFSYFCSKT